MKVIKVLWNKGSKFALLTDRNFAPYVICSHYSADLPENEQWCWGKYYDNFAEFCKEILRLSEIISYS